MSDLCPTCGNPVLPDAAELERLRADAVTIRETNDGLYLAVQMTAKEQDRLRTALRDIIVRCEEGDARSDWRTIITRIARAALQPEGSAGTRCPSCDSGKREHRGFAAGDDLAFRCEDGWHAAAEGSARDGE